MRKPEKTTKSTGKTPRRTYHNTDHTFAVCAYGESPYLEACLRSLKNQSVPSGILIATSTPNDHISALAEKYGLPLHIRTTEAVGIAADWNFALRCAPAPLVTLAHQDDLYHRNYTEDVLAALNTCRHPLIAFTDYQECRGKKTVTANCLLKIKRLMLFPLRFRPLRGSRFLRRRILSFGNAICCPSVTFVRENLTAFAFRNNMKSNIDWQAWEELSRRKGAFAYVPKPCMEHRIHHASTTSELLEADARKQEDLQVLRRFWPVPLAAVIEHFYQKSEKSNQLTEAKRSR